MCVSDRGRHLSRCARGVLKYRQVAGCGLRFIAVRATRQRRHERMICGDDAHAIQRTDCCHLLGRGQQQARRAVASAERNAIGTEQGEQRHRDGTTLHGAEHRGIKFERGVQHDRDSIASPYILGGEPVREAGRPRGQLGKADRLVGPVGVGNTQRHPARHGVAIDALVPDIQMLAVAVEQIPKPRGREQTLGVGIRRVMRQITHAEPSRLRPLVVQTGS